VAYLLVTSGLRHIPALEASLILLIEPVLNPVWAWLFQGERPGAWAVLGGAIILGSTTLKGWLDARAQRLVAPPTELAVAVDVSSVPRRSS
jgi:drug/metabolite transporter (DMT)-like permease